MPFLCLFYPATSLSIPTSFMLFSSICLFSIFSLTACGKGRGFILLNTAGSSQCDGRPEGQALGSAEPEAVCVCQARSLMVTVEAF